MITYLYHCERCCQDYEVEQRIIDAPLDECETPDCPGRPRRLIATTTSFVLKGSGWYRDGYGSGR